MNRVNIVDKARKIHKACINGESASYVVDELRILREELRKEIQLETDVRQTVSSGGVLLAEDIKPYKKSYADEDDLMEEFCNRINCHSCDGIDPSGEPNGYGCKPMENFITKNDKLFECDFVDNSSK